MTNLEFFRTASREELAKFICNLFSADGCVESCPGYQYCYFGHKGLLDWLDKEFGDGTEE